MSDIIFRIQDHQGRGPFKPGFSSKWVQVRDDHKNLIPWFEEFGDIREKLLVGEYSGCGCRTPEQLRRWFNEKEYKKLRKLGYHCYRMKVGRIIAESNIQAVFGSARPLRELGEAIRLY